MQAARSTEPAAQPRRNAWGLAGAILAAVAASACCVGPLLLVALGASGAWIGSLSALEPYRPIFVAVTVVLLGLSFYRVYRTPKQSDCAADSACARTGRRRFTRIALWSATVAVAALLAAPALIATTRSGDDAAGAVKGESGSAAIAAAAARTVTLVIGKMTCAGCAKTIEKALRRVQGVTRARVTLKPPRATVSFEASKTSVGELVRAITAIGYTARVSKGG